MIFAMLYSSPPCMGRVTDLTMEGFSLEYLAETEQYREGFQVDLVLSGGQSLKQVPCRQVSDQVTRPSGPPFFGPEVRCCTLAFGPLSPHQQEALKQMVDGRGDWGQAATSTWPTKSQAPARPDLLSA